MMINRRRRSFLPPPERGGNKRKAASQPAGQQRLGDASPSSFPTSLPHENENRIGKANKIIQYTRSDMYYHAGRRRGCTPFNVAMWTPSLPLAKCRGGSSRTILHTGCFSRASVGVSPEVVTYHSTQRSSTSSTRKPSTNSSIHLHPLKSHLPTASLLSIPRDNKDKYDKTKTPKCIILYAKS